MESNLFEKNSVIFNVLFPGRKEKGQTLWPAVLARTFSMAGDFVHRNTKAHSTW